MKKLLIILFLFPAMVQAQEEQTAQPDVPKNEIGLSTGVVLESIGDFQLNTAYMGSKAMLTYYRNIKQFQLGLVLDAGVTSFDYFFYAPTVAVNHRFNARKGYFYAGTALGYYHAVQTYNIEQRDFSKENGYTFGLQGGYLLPVGKRLALTSEIAVRSTQVWFQNGNYIPLYFGSTQESYFQTFTDTDFYITIPVTLGLRYRF